MDEEERQGPEEEEEEREEEEEELEGLGGLEGLEWLGELEGLGELEEEKCEEEEKQIFPNFRSQIRFLNEKNFGWQLVGQHWSAAQKRQVGQFWLVAEQNFLTFRSPTDFYKSIGDSTGLGMKPVGELVLSEGTSMKGAASLQKVGMDGAPFRIGPDDARAEPLSHFVKAEREMRSRGGGLVGESRNRGGEEIQYLPSRMTTLS